MQAPHRTKGPADPPSVSGACFPAFDYQPRTRVVFGAGTISRLGELCRELNGRRVLLVTDPGLEEAGHPQRAEKFLREAGLDVTLFDDVHANPTTADVERGLCIARDSKIDILVGLGGGSSMDCAKGINFLYTNGGRMEDYRGKNKATQPMLPMIAVPTTAGTGSEAQSFALIADPHTHMKMACGDVKATCRIAVLDPELTQSMPASVTAATGIDALSHAVESFVTSCRNPISQLFARQAWHLLSKGFPAVIASPRDVDARARMLLGAHLAGAAIENSMLGAAHALANPLSAHYEMIHGVAIAVMLPHVVRYNQQAVAPLYGQLASDAGLCPADDPHACEHLAKRLTELSKQAGLPTRLGECGVDGTKLSILAAEAALQWTGTFNPRPVDVNSLREIYECAM